MHIEPPRPEITPDTVRALMDLLTAVQEYNEKTGRNPHEDLELLTHLEAMEDDLKSNATVTFITLANAGFHLYGDHKREEHYYDATRDYVTDAVEKHGLRARWCEACGNPITLVTNTVTGAVDACACTRSGDHVWNEPEEGEN